MSHYALLQKHYFKSPDETLELTLETRFKALQAFKKAGLLSVDTARMLLRFSKLIVNPQDISPIFKGGHFTRHKSFQLSLDYFRGDPATLALMQEQYLAPEPYDLEALLQLPPESLGYIYAQHMRENQLDVVFYPPLEQVEDDDIAYLRKRARQTHDVHHVVLGFPAVDVGEMAISAFYLSQYNVPLSALLLGFGFLYTILREPERIEELVTALNLGWNTGQQCPKFMGIKWEDYFELPLEQVRRELDVPVAPKRFPWPDEA